MENTQDAISRLRSSVSDQIIMDDLFEGYIALGPIGDFLEESPPSSYSSRFQIAPRAEEHVSSSEGYTKPLGVTASSSDHAALGALRQRRGHTKSRLGCLLCKKRKIKVGLPHFGVRLLKLY